MGNIQPFLGESNPKEENKNTKRYGCLLTIGALIVLSFIGSMMDDGKGKKADAINENNQTSTLQIIPQPAVDNSKSDEEELSGIEQRIKDNKESLKTHYASKYELDKSSSDRVTVDYISSKGENNLSKKAKKIRPLVYNQSRELYASFAEEGFMKSGMNITVSAIGKDNKTLKISFSLMSQPMVYKFQNDIKTPETAKSLGFSKIIYTNGFHSMLGQTWTVRL